MQKHWLTVMMVGICWMGCGTQKQVPLKSESPQSLVTRVQYQDTSLCLAQKSVSTVSFTYQGKKEKVQMVAFYNHPSLFKIEILSILGVAIVQMVIQDRNVTAYFPIEKKLIEGTIESPILQRSWGIDLTLEDIQNFYNRMRINETEIAMPPAGLEMLQNRYALSWQHADGKVRYWISGDYTVEKKEWFTGAGELKKVMVFKKYRVWNNMQPFPTAVTLALLETGTNVEMVFQEREFMMERIPLETFRLPIPDGVTPIQVE